MVPAQDLKQFLHYGPLSQFLSQTTISQRFPRQASREAFEPGTSVPSTVLPVATWQTIYGDHRKSLSVRHHLSHVRVPMHGQANLGLREAGARRRCLRLFQAALRGAFQGT